MTDDTAPKKARKAKATEEEQEFSEDGHVLLGGARWHYPKQGDPTTCAVPGCSRILGLPAPGTDDEPGDEPDGDTEDDSEQPDEDAAA